MHFWLSRFIYIFPERDATLRAELRAERDEAIAVAIADAAEREKAERAQAIYHHQEFGVPFVKKEVSDAAKVFAEM